eukprot:Hpha_TRINITY_DN16706_c1_g20::TRINITY_DN16706_c1_g20_i1::g.78788::m.78788/K05850/ATP2B; Ca2+ transporting ATPase, plasma membrane
MSGGDKEERLLAGQEMVNFRSSEGAGGDPVHNKIRNMLERKEIGTLQDMGGMQGLAQLFGVDPAKGHDTASVQRSQQRHGQNCLPPLEEITYFKFLKEACQDKMMQLLVVLGIVAIIINMCVAERGEDKVHYGTAWIDGGMILVAVTLVIGVTTVNDYLKEKKFQALDEATSKQAFKVIRDGHLVEVDVADIVAGDVVEYGEGTVIPADGIFLQGDGIKIDESACTGENDDKKKDPEHDPFIISGTSVVCASPQSRYLCIAVGENSFAGALEMQTRQPAQPTPLQEKLDDLADLVGKVGIVVALALFFTVSAIVLIKWAAGGQAPVARDFLEYAIIGVSIVVVAVPEGLPLSVTIALAYSMSAMMEDNNMVRSLAACETMGAATNICSDKTGTLTKNIMTTDRLFVGMQDLPASQKDASGAGAVFLDAVSYNSTASRRPPDPLKNEGPGLVWEGNKTEQGLLRWAVDVGQGFEAIRKTPGKTVRVYPFSSAKKSMTVLVRDDKSGEFIQYSKGASEIVFKHCTHYLDASGQSRDITQAERDQVTKVIGEYAGDALRTIGVAYNPNTGLTDFPEEDPFTYNLTWVGVAGIHDPVRDEVPAAVGLCQEAGVTVRMCTGDNIATASAIGRICGLLTPDGKAMEGPEFRKMFTHDRPGFDAMLPKLQVLARCSPTDKQLLVGSLMLRGEVVAVTGDGTNDAPALALADVGFAMDDGTQVAKKASKIILLDNNFVSVVKACRWGRNVNDNIRKFLQFQFTVNVVLLIITFIGAVSDACKTDGHGQSPMAAIHLLWCNLIMDTLAALALSTERPNDSLMHRPPTYRSAPLLSRRMWRFVGVGAAYQLIVVLILLYAGKDLFDVDDNDDFPPVEENFTDQRNDAIEDADVLHRTVIFNTFVFLQVFNWFNARKLYDEWNIFEGFNRSPIFLPIVFFTAAFQAIMVEVAQEFLETRSLGGPRWAACIIIAIMMWPIGLLIRVVPINMQMGYDEPVPEIEPPSEGKRAMIEKVQEESIAVAQGEPQTTQGLLRTASSKGFKEATHDHIVDVLEQSATSGLGSRSRTNSFVHKARGPRGDTHRQGPRGSFSEGTL